MAGTEKIKIEATAQEVTENLPAAELTEVDDIAEYIQPSNLEMLKARYAAVDEDEQIRNESFEPVKKSGLIRKVRPESTIFGYYSSPVSPKDEIRTDVSSPLSQVFDETKTQYDADTVSFSDIELEVKPEEKEVATQTVPEKPQPKKRGRPRKVILEVTQPTTEKTEETAETETPAPPTVNNRYNFDTHTTVIYVDESADDGIKRNSEDELSAAFEDNNHKKRRRLPWSAKRT